MSTGRTPRINSEPTLVQSQYPIDHQDEPLPVQLLNKVSNSEVHKPTIATHYRRELDAIASRILTILIHHVQNSDQDRNGIYWIDIGTIKSLLDWKSNHHAPIYEAISSLANNSIIWNMWGADKTLQPELQTVFLQSVIFNRSARTGKIGFEFSNILHAVVKRPTVFGRQKVIMLPLLAKPTHAYGLYEVFIDCLSRNESPVIFKLEELYSFLNLDTESTYCKNYRDFRKRVIGPSIDRINEVSDILIEYVPIRSGRKYTAIKFDIGKKLNWQEFLPFDITSQTINALNKAYPQKIGTYTPHLLKGSLTDNQESDELQKLCAKIRKIGVGQKILDTALTMFGADGVFEVFANFEHLLEKRRDDIKDPSAYLATLLRDGTGVKSSSERLSEAVRKEKSDLQNRKREATALLQQITKHAEKLKTREERKFLDELSEDDWDRFKNDFEEEFNKKTLDQASAAAFAQDGWGNPLMQTVLQAYATKDKFTVEFFMDNAAKDLDLSIDEIQSELTEVNVCLSSLQG